MTFNLHRLAVVIPLGEANIKDTKEVVIQQVTAGPA
jgi:hypothetical protein